MGAVAYFCFMSDIEAWRSERRTMPSPGAPIAEPATDAGRSVGEWDEFSLLHENASEFGIGWTERPPVERLHVDVASGRRVSAIAWGVGEPEVVLVHGGAQNAHTWDTVALALDRPLVAVDLPGHGRSDWKDDADYSPMAMAGDLAIAIGQLAPRAGLVVGMSLGGLTSICLAARNPELVRRLAVVDVTPGATREKASPIMAFVAGPESFESYDAILERTVAFNPTRSLSSLRRGVMHNAFMKPDGEWTWRYDRRRRERQELPDFPALWDEVSRISAPVLLLRGSLSGVVDDADVAELLRRQPGAKVVTVEGAGHSIQGDKPLELARILAEFAGSSATPG